MRVKKLGTMPLAYRQLKNTNKTSSATDSWDQWDKSLGFHHTNPPHPWPNVFVFAFKYFKGAFFILWVSGLLFPSPVLSQSYLRTTKGAGLYVPGEILVTFREGVSQQDRTRILGAAGTAQVLHRPELYKVKLAPGLTVEEAVRQAKNEGSVLIAQPNYRYYLSAPCGPNPLNDRYYAGPENWPLTIIQAPQAWTLFSSCPPGSTSVTVAVIDTGISKTNPDLPVSMQAPGYNFNANNTNTTDDFRSEEHTS